MKYTTLAVVFSALTLQTAAAGGLTEPVMEPEIVVEESTTGKGGYVIQLALLAVLAMHIANN